MALVAFPYARPQGLGKAVKDNASWRQAILATVFALLISLAVAWWWADWRVLLAMAGAALLVWAGARYTLQRIPGLTGDIYGALNEIIEVAVLLVLASASYSLRRETHLFVSGLPQSSLLQYFGMKTEHKLVSSRCAKPLNALLSNDHPLADCPPWTHRLE